MRAGRRVRIADLGPVEPDCLAASRKRPPDDHPLVGIAVLEVRVGERARELVEPPRGIRAVVAGVAAVSVDALWPVVPVAHGIVVRPRAVVLCAALDLSRIRRVDRHIDELQGVEVPVDVRDQVRHARQHPPAVRQACGAQERPLVRVTPERQVAERPIGADHAAIRTLEDLCRIRRVNDDRVLVRVDVVGRPEACEPWRYTAERFLKGRAQPAPARRSVLHVVGKVGERAVGGGARGRGSGSPAVVE